MDKKKKETELDILMKKLKAILDKSQDSLQVVLALEKEFKKVGFGDNDVGFYVQSFELYDEVCKFFKEKNMYCVLAVFLCGKKEDGTDDYAIQYMRFDGENVVASRLYK